MYFRPGGGGGSIDPVLFSAEIQGPGTPPAFPAPLPVDCGAVVLGHLVVLYALTTALAFTDASYSGEPLFLGPLPPALRPAGPRKGQFTIARQGAFSFRELGAACFYEPATDATALQLEIAEFAPIASGGTLVLGARHPSLRWLPSDECGVSQEYFLLRYPL